MLTRPARCPHVRLAPLRRGFSLVGAVGTDGPVHLTAECACEKSPEDRLQSQPRSTLSSRAPWPRSGGAFSSPWRCRIISVCPSSSSAQRSASVSCRDRRRSVGYHRHHRRYGGAPRAEFGGGLLGPCSLRRLHHGLDRGVAIGAGQLIFRDRLPTGGRDPQMHDFCASPAKAPALRGCQPHTDQVLEHFMGTPRAVIVSKAYPLGEPASIRSAARWLSVSTMGAVAWTSLRFAIAHLVGGEPRPDKI
jgi:hypothetical protein